MRLSTALGSVKKGQEALVPRAEAAVAATGSGPLADAAAKSKRVAFDAASETSELESVEVVK